MVDPFAVVHVNDSLTLDCIMAEISPSRHYAFAMTPAAFRRIQTAEIPSEDSPHAVGNRRGPGEAPGARGMGKAVYFHDPSGYQLERI